MVRYRSPRYAAAVRIARYVAAVRIARYAAAVRIARYVAAVRIARYGELCASRGNGAAVRIAPNAAAQAAWGRPANLVFAVR
jgi:ADP-ribosylglycohydrolase